MPAFFLALLFFFSFPSLLQAEPPEGINALVAAWMRFDSSSGQDLKSLERFQKQLSAFSRSPLYRNYERNRIFRKRLLTGPMESVYMASLSGELRSALLSGDSAGAKVLTDKLRDSLYLWMGMNNAEGRRSTRTFMQLFFMFFVIVILMTTFLLFTLLALVHSRVERSEIEAFSHALMQGEEAERKRLALELHDSVLQELRALPGSEPLSAEIRSLCGELLPPDFTLVSFGDSLADLAHLFERQTGLDCVTQFDPALSAPLVLRAERLLHCYRIVQEALTNVRKHAAARKVIVTARLGESLLICVSDDGVGLTQGRARRSDGIGLRGIGMRSMRERAAILGAKLEFLSEEGRGLMVRLEVPLEAGARGGDYV